MLTVRSFLIAVALLVLCIGVGACGGTRESVVARVDHAVITSGSVDHWIRTLGGRHVAPGQRQYTSLRERALGYLISTQWLLGEASNRGLGPSDDEVRARYKRKVVTSFPGGEQEFNEFLTASGHTAADIMLETRLEVATARLLRAATANVPTMTSAQVQHYYQLHHKQFTVPESRVFEIVVAHGYAVAIKIKHQVEAGAPMERFGEEQSGSSNPLDKPGQLGGNAIEKVVFSGEPHTLLGPLRYRNVDYDLIEVTRVVPAKLRPLDEVRAAIDKQLASDAHQRALASFIRAWRLRWRAKTDCIAGELISKCARYPAEQALAREDPYAFD